MHLTLRCRGRCSVTFGRVPQRLPKRNLLIMLGGYSTPVDSIPGLVGRGLLRSATRGTDENFQRLLSNNQLVVFLTRGQGY